MSCSDYIVDPRGSKEPQEIIRDKIECKTIIKENLNAFVRVFDGDKLMKTCLKGSKIFNIKLGLGGKYVRHTTQNVDITSELEKISFG